MPSRRRRDRSKTPEINWATLPDAPPVPVATEKKRPRDERPAPQPVVEDDTSEPGNGEENNGSLVAARALEKVAWRNLVVRLAGLRGDPKVEDLLRQKHPELQNVAEICGATGATSITLQEAKDCAKQWFARGLKGSRLHGPMERANLCNRLADELKEHAVSLLRAATPERLAEALEKHFPEEGPLVCSTFAKELEGSRYEGLWISREGPGSFILGDDHEGSGLPTCDDIGARIAPRIRVLPRVANSQLLVDKFFQEGEDVAVPAKVAIGPFLSVYFEGLSLKQAVAKWREQAAARAAATTAVRPSISATALRASSSASAEQETLKALSKNLPPGWEMRESRSKKGVYYYAHPATGRSQLERPKA